LLQLEAARLANLDYSDSTEPTLAPNGEGLHSMLAHLALNQPDAFQELQNHLRQIVPAIKRIRFMRTPVERVEAIPERTEEKMGVRYEQRRYMTEVLLFDMVGAGSLPAHLASEGTLLVLGLLAVLYSPNRPQVLLLDDVDHALHPKAQLELVSLFRALLERDPSLQLVVTSHSPYILDRVTPQEVRLVVQGDDGFSVCGCLEDHPEFDRWKEEMTPGEFWMMFGEKWLTTRSATPTSAARSAF
jgi:predicted ATPase